MKTIRDLTDRVEEAHTRHLREVKSLEEQTRSVSANPAASPQLLNQSTVGEDTNVTFESLVQGGKSSADIPNNDDMFGALVNGTSSSAMAPQKPIVSNNNAPSWSSPTLAPAPLNQTTIPVNTNGWSSSQQSKTNSWNSSTSINPIASPQQNNKTTNWNTLQNNNNTSSTLSGWTQSIKSTSTPMSQQYPSLNSPPSFNMNQMSLNNNSNSNGNANYNALRTMPASTTPQQASMMTLSSSMGLLKPISPSTNSSTKPGSQQATKVNLHAFDPLG
jgi:SCY1-like protein 2